MSLGLARRAVVAVRRAVVAAGVNITDSFTRADSTTTLGTTDTGQAWTAVSGTWGIGTNRAYKPSGAGDHAAVVEAAATDVTATVTLATAAAFYGLAPRVVDANNLWIVYYNTASTMLLTKIVGGAYTVVGNTGTLTTTTGDVFSVVMAGPAFTVRRNGVDMFAATDATHGAATRHGMYSGVNNAFLDNFSITA